MSSFQFSEESQSHFLSQPAEKIPSSSSSSSTPPRNKKSGSEHAEKKDKKKGTSKSFPDIEIGRANDSATALGVKIKKDKDGRPALKRPDRTGKMRKPTRSTGSSGDSFNKQVDTVHDSFIEKIPFLRGKITSDALKKYCLATTIIIILIIPAILNIEIEEVLGQRNKEDYNAGAPQAPAGEVIGGSGMKGNDALSSKIIGAEVNEAVGLIKLSKNCVAFYSDNPEKREDALATRICPQTRDSDVSFHINERIKL